jgi:hypothetical protein
MALIRHGSFEDLSIGVQRQPLGLRVTQPSPMPVPIDLNIRNLSEAVEFTRAFQPLPITLGVSTTPRGLALHSLKLTKGFEGFLQKVFIHKKENNVYFLAWSWDLSGAPVVEYPGGGGPSKSCIIPLTVGAVREFLGAGTVLFPARPVTAGLATRIMLWESDQEDREFGKTLTTVAHAIKASTLNSVLSLIATGLGTAVAGVTLVKDAALELADIVGKILQASGDDYVDFYEGYYPTSATWTPGNEVHQGNASEIVLARFV